MLPASVLVYLRASEVFWYKIFITFTGLVSKPIEGASKKGVGGFFKGIAKGVTGLVVKPVAGVLDGVSTITEGVSNTIAPVDDIKVTRKKSRYPRLFYGNERVYKDYNPEEARVLDFLANGIKAKKKKYSKFHVMDCVIFTQKLSNRVQRLCVLMALEKIFLIAIGEKVEILWKLKPTVLADIVTTQDSIKLMLKDKTKSIKVNPTIVLE